MDNFDIKCCIFDPKTPRSIVESTNGDEILDPILIKCIPDENLENGDYFLDAEFLIDKNGLWKSVKEESILKVLLDYGYEYFVISKLNKRNKSLVAFARQLTISECIDLWLDDVRPTETTGQGALTHLLDGAEGVKEIELYSDIDVVSTAYYQNMNLYQALHDSDQSFINRWGGEIQRRGYKVFFNKRIGFDRGYTIESNKNLTGFDATTNVDQIITRIKPIGFDGLTIDGYVYSDKIDLYRRVKTAKKVYSDVKVVSTSDDEGWATPDDAKAELIKRATLEFTEKKVDEIKADYKINFVLLDQTEEYKNYVQAERVFLGDTVSVYEYELDIHIQVRVYKRKYDVIKQMPLETSLTNNDINPTGSKVSVGDVINEIENIIRDKDQMDEYIKGLINAGITNSFVVVRENEIVIGDTKDINTMTNVWRFNKNGLAHSQTGYFGDFNLAITGDGKIVADFIKTGILDASLLKTGIIRNQNGSFEIDLASSNGILFKTNGIKSVEILKNMINFFDWDGEGSPIGSIYSTRLNNNENMPGIVLANNLNCLLSLSYEQGDNFYSYLRCDKNNISGSANVPITIFEDVEFKSRNIWVGYGINDIYNSSSNNLVIKCLNNFIIADGVGDSPLSRLISAHDYIGALLDDRYYFRASPNEMYCANGNKKFVSIKNRYFTFWDGDFAYFYISDTDWVISKRSMQVEGDFKVTGAKNCVQKTESFGDRLFYSVEDCESFLTDTGKSETIKNIDDEYFEVKILIDPIYKESVDLSDYHIQINKYNFGDYEIKDQTEDYFILRSDKKIKFSWTIKAHRKGYEDVRLEINGTKHTLLLESNKFYKEDSNNAISEKVQFRHK